MLRGLDSTQKKEKDMGGDNRGEGAYCFLKIKEKPTSLINDVNQGTT